VVTLATSPLGSLLEAVLGQERMGECATQLLVPDVLFGGHVGSEPVPRHVGAQALMMALFAKSLTEVPLARSYVADKVARSERVCLDHGALRTVKGTSSGDLPTGQEAFSRLLEPLGFFEADSYPLGGLRMLGHGWRHRDFPEQIAQLFVSELDVRDFSTRFQEAAKNVVSQSRDPLSDSSKDTLDQLRSAGSAPMDALAMLIENLLACFGRHHPEAAWADYAILREESPEMAWIATEGNTFNHAADRVSDVDAVAQAQKDCGRPMKETIERSHSGTVCQTAFRAGMVRRRFRLEDGQIEEREVPGSFFEFISRGEHPEERGLDLRFDAGNAQGIFTMTRR
jgi:hypothetical protein